MSIYSPNKSIIWDLSLDAFNIGKLVSKISFSINEIQQLDRSKLSIFQKNRWHMKFLTKYFNPYRATFISNWLVGINDQS